jgi:hypothetical protein
MPKWVQKNTMGANIRYGELVKANLFAIEICFPIFIISSLALYFISRNKTTSVIWNGPEFLILLLDGFSALTGILALMFLIFNHLIEVMNAHLKRPLWTYVLVIFIIGCLLQIVGIAQK